MRKCDSCGKVVVNEQDYMCPHCGAVSNKHCDHNTHLPDDKYNRANDYRTTAAEHKSKTYDYEKAPKTDASQKFDINDLANIKNVEDAKQVAKKAFIEQDQNGRKKFKPLAIVLIVIFAVNIFGNLLGALGDGIDTVFDELEYAFEEIELEDYTLGVDKIIHSFTVNSTIDGATYNKETDCLTIDFSELYFLYNNSVNEDYETIEKEWSDDFGYPAENLYSNQIKISATIFNEKEILDVEMVDGYSSYHQSITLYGEISDLGMLYIYGLEPHIKSLSDQSVYLNLLDLTLISETTDTNQQFEYWISLPFNFAEINNDDSVELFNIYTENDEVVFSEYDLNEQFSPPEEYHDKYVEHIEFNDRDTYSDNIFESIPASATYTETVTLVD